MGIFDGILGKKEGGLEIEKTSSGYAVKPLKKTEHSKVNRVDIVFNCAAAPYAEHEAIKDIVANAGIADTFTPDVLVTTSYEVIPSIMEYMATNEMPEDLNAFVMAKAMMKGIARGPIEMSKIQVNSFQIKDTMGIIILKEA